MRSLSHIPHTKLTPHATIVTQKSVDAKNISVPYTLDTQDHKVRTAPAIQFTPSHANGSSARVTNKLRVMPTLLKVESTTSLPLQQQLLLLLLII